MAKMTNIKAYKDAEKGVRVFRCASPDFGGLKTGFWRRGYGVFKSRERAGYITFRIERDNV